LSAFIKNILLHLFDASTNKPVALYLRRLPDIFLNAQAFRISVDHRSITFANSLLHRFLEYRI